MVVLRSGALWWNLPPRRSHRSRRNPAKSSSSSGSFSGARDGGWSLADFPFKQAAVASSLVLAGDTIAQTRDRLFPSRSDEPESEDKALSGIGYDWLRSLRMASYGFLLYGPGTYVWYRFLDNCMPKKTFASLSAKVILNQIVLGPCVIAVIFAWNNLWLGKLSELPNKYQKDALPTLLYGLRFWIPVSILNFSMIPLSARVAFMSSCSVFWNFYLSSTVSK